MASGRVGVGKDSFFFKILAAGSLSISIPSGLGSFLFFSSVSSSFVLCVVVGGPGRTGK